MTPRLACSVLVAVLLAGCEVVPSASWQIVTRTFDSAPSATQSQARPDVRFEYLQLDRGASSLRLVLGYRSLLALTAPGRVAPIQEHWYSGDRELLVLRDGRLEQALGMAIEWRSSQAPAQPDWDALLASPRPLQWQRRRDEMPGYRYGLVDEIESRRVDPTSAAIPDVSGLGEGLVWVQEDVRSPLADGRIWQHRQWFALAREGERWRVRWSRQCLAPDWCLDLKTLDRAPS